MSKTASFALCALLASVVAAPVAAGETHDAVNKLPAPTAEQKAQAVAQYAQIRDMAAFGEHCNWLTPIEKLAVDISADERWAWLTWQKADLAQAKKEADARIKQADGADCKALDDKRTAVQFGAWQMRSSWALRGYSMLPSEKHPAWFAGKSSLQTHRKALEAAFNGLLDFNAESIALSVELFDQTSPTWLSVRCKDKDAGCPAPIKDKGERAYAESVVKLAERYAQALESVDDKAGIPKA